MAGYWDIPIITGELGNFLNLLPRIGCFRVDHVFYYPHPLLGDQDFIYLVVGGGELTFFVVGIIKGDSKS